MMHGFGSDTLVGVSIKTLLLTLLVLLSLGIYIGVVIYGENSLTVLYRLKEKQEKLSSQKKQLQQQNVRLQKHFFELKQFEARSQS